MPHYQVKSGGAAEICRETGLQAGRHARTYTHTLENPFKKPGRFSTSSSTGSQTGRGGVPRTNHCWLNACEWLMAQRGRKGNQDVVMHLSDTPLSVRADCNLPGPRVARYCSSFHMSQTIKTRLSISVPTRSPTLHLLTNKMHTNLKKKNKYIKYPLMCPPSSLPYTHTYTQIPELHSQRASHVFLTFIVFISLQQQTQGGRALCNVSSYVSKVAAYRGA